MRPVSNGSATIYEFDAEPVKTPDEVTQLVKTIEVSSQKVIDQSSTQAQR